MLKLSTECNDCDAAGVGMLHGTCFVYLAAASLSQGCCHQGGAVMDRFCTILSVSREEKGSSDDIFARLPCFVVGCKQFGACGA